MTQGHFTTSMQPNSKNQMWSKWVFGIEANLDKLPTVREVRENAGRFFKKGFQSSAGRIRVLHPDVLSYVIEVEIEGPPAHDPDYRTHVKRHFIEHFLFKGFGYSARLVRFDVKILSGDRQDGTPADQLIAIPTIPLR